MQVDSIPSKFPLVWAQNASGPYVRDIPITSQIGVNPGYASLNDGFPPLNATPIAAGGVPPFEQDINGILRQITRWLQWVQAGGPIVFDAAFASTAAPNIGGYPAGAIIESAIVAGKFWLSTADNNTTNPDEPTTSANWIQHPSMKQTGMFEPWAGSTPPPGYVWAKNAYTIGNAPSGASYAAADAVLLYIWHWNTFPNSQCPVTGGRGANALADFNAGKPIQVLDLAGACIVGTDNATGRLSGVPVTSGNILSAGSIIGENLHALQAAENAAHAHANTLSDYGHWHWIPIAGGSYTTGQGGGTYPNALYNTNSGNTGTAYANIAINNASSGSGTAHNTVQRSMTANWILKL